MEPERRIEKLLRAFAKKRREQAGDSLELHPVARQQLQNEIARRAAGKNRTGWFSGFFVGLRPKLVLAVCFIGLVVLGFVLLPGLQHHKPALSTLASANLPGHGMAPAEKIAPVPAPPSVSAATPPAAGEGSRAFDDKQPAVSGSVAMKPIQSEITGANRQIVVPPTEIPKQAATFENGVAQTEMPTGIAAVSTAPSNEEMFDFKTDHAATANSFGGATVASTPALSKDAASQTLPSMRPPMGTISVTTNGTMFAANEDARKQLNLQKQPAAMPPASAAFLDRSKKESDATIAPVSQVFNRSDAFATSRRPAGSLNVAAPVLTSFRVEQAGNALRVIDADGSVYTGVVRLPQQAISGRAGSPKNAPSTSQLTKTAAPFQAAQNYFFRVAGTNRNLRQNVVFSGNLIPLTNFLTGKGVIGGNAAVQGAADLPVQSLLSNSRIAGKAVIGNQQEIEVNATSAP